MPAKPSVGAFAQRLDGKGVVLVPIGGERRHLLDRKLARRLADRHLLFAEVEIHAP